MMKVMAGKGLTCWPKIATSWFLSESPRDGDANGHRFPY